jgi:multicomponent Na+:H+ antiporter subunit D
MALNGAAAHAFAHILYKGLLFMGAGAVLYTTGKSRLTELGGLARAMPLVLGLYMIGAFSISGFPLFSGFVSKSMVIAAAGESHLNLAAMLLYLASVGTFLHTGLKLPYFTWFGPDRGVKLERRVPAGMYLGMGLAAALCFAIGVFPSAFYTLLPFPADYHPYTAAHLAETGQLLIFTGLGFWLLIGKLGGEATVTMDTDWFYRKPSGLAERFLVQLPAQFFHAVEEASISLSKTVAQLGSNPARAVVKARNLAARYFFGSRYVSREPRVFNPHYYRFSLGMMTLIVLAAFTVLMLLIILEVMRGGG